MNVYLPELADGFCGFAVGRQEQQSPLLSGAVWSEVCGVGVSGVLAGQARPQANAYHQDADNCVCSPGTHFFASHMVKI